jgi:hypothetical protein
VLGEPDAPRYGDPAGPAWLPDATAGTEGVETLVAMVRLALAAHAQLLVVYTTLRPGYLVAVEAEAPEDLGRWAPLWSTPDGAPDTSQPERRRQH